MSIKTNSYHLEPVRAALLVHKMLLQNYEEGQLLLLNEWNLAGGANLNNFFASVSRHSLRLNFSSFNPFPSSPSVKTDDSNIVFGNKTKPLVFLILGFR